jgi:hypothetical protein
MKKLILAVIAVASMSLGQAQTVVGDVTMPNTMAVEGAELVLNGAGIREKVFIDLYAAGLYVPQKSKKAKDIINADESMAIKLEIISFLISSDKMISAINDGFDLSMSYDTSSLKSEIETFKGFFSEKIVQGNVFDISYAKDKGTTVHKNGKEVGMIEGLEFKKALFGIWLGSQPIDKDLKKGLLKAK